VNPSYITPIFALAGFALFNLQVLREYYRRELNKSTALDHASKVFPHTNEIQKPYQKRKP